MKPSPNAILTLRRPASPKAASQPSAPEPVQAVPGLRDLPLVSSETLLKGTNHLHIVHNGELYQLRATRQGKLILTK
jgi:hemin uptake protein HemP